MTYDPHKNHELMKEAHQSMREQITPASLDELLKEWEAEAEVIINSNNKGLLLFNERILSLIAVVRKQAESLHFIFDKAHDSDDENNIDLINEAAKALTEAERILKG